ncbi:MAG TPA: hypothetical protein VKB05_01850 [Pyrinomonadaceae bacterium]|nr:hypothetical protein [Pyrinomonadaceae bacterium]
MSEDLQRKPSSGMQRYIIYAAVLLLVFLLGFIPMWLKARAAASSLAETERQLVLCKTQSDLASAVIDARRGDYEPARQALSRFFTSLSADTSNYTEAQRNSMQTLFAGRDELITLLARNDPASADRLSDLFVAYRKIMNG